ncbi:MAG: hypothetical protein COA47_14785 [Robiginitomaculum sp.]|nr:MAG: hypothetical protein COA47_14785 [Robiginitomaculum sp.]
MRPIEKVTIHFKGMAPIWSRNNKWIARIFLVALVFFMISSYLRGEEMSISLAWNVLFSIILPIFIVINVLLFLPLVIFRFLQSIRYCRKNNMKLSGFYNQEEADILNVWRRK